jgi:hypothetical protein
MRVWFLLPAVLLVVLVSGCSEPGHDELVYCSADSDCVCGLIAGTDQCYIGNRAFIEPSDRCFRMCFGDETRMARCADNVCMWVKVAGEGPAFPVADIILEDLGENESIAGITVRNTGPVAFSPTLSLVIVRNDLMIHSAALGYGNIAVGGSQTVQTAVPRRNITGEWVYNLTLLSSDGRVINHSIETYQRLPPQGIEAFMYFHIEPKYLYLENISVGVRNIGSISFIPAVQMTIYKGDMQSIYSESYVYSKLDQNKSELKDFPLPPIENRTYYFNFILTEKEDEIVLEEITHKVIVGT